MFRTELTITPAAQQLARTARVLTMGSCFADSIGQRLADNKVATLVNPLGTVFQPLALGKLLRAAVGEDVDWQQHVVSARGRWQSYDLHSSIGAASPVALLQTIAEQVYHVGTFVRNADVVLLTLGTAWAYRLRETGELVSNCHKMPAELFEKELLTPDDIINALAETHAYLRRINPQLRFVLTVSPVRHLKDTLPLNAVSKSVLRVACHYLSELLPDVAYFPAYELLTDDLRDYRFYAADMLHPSAVAEDYVWEKFARTYFDADFSRFRKDWAAVQQALHHRPLHAAAPEHRQFLAGTVAQLERLAGRGVDVGHELADVQQRLAALPEPVQLLAVPEPEVDDEERIDIGDAIPATATGVDVNARTAALESLEAAAAAGALAPNDGPTANRPGRLSPEEFRQQRANRQRGGRGERRNGRPEPATPQAQEQLVQPAPAAAEIPDATETVETQPIPVAAADEQAGVVATTANGLAADGQADADAPIRKKKRRSRGGAKRTARKNAARLAEMDLSPAPATSNSLGAAVAPAATVEASAEAATPAAGTEPRKSSVITKSVPVKRGGRNQRGRGQAAEATPDTSETAVSAAAALSAANTAATAAEVAALATAPTTAATLPMTATPETGAPAEAATDRGANARRQPTVALPLASDKPTLAETVLGLKPKPKPTVWPEQGQAAASAATPEAASASSPAAPKSASAATPVAPATVVTAAPVGTPVASPPATATPGDAPAAPRRGGRNRPPKAAQQATSAAASSALATSKSPAAPAAGSTSAAPNSAAAPTAVPAVAAAVPTTAVAPAVSTAAKPAAKGKAATIPAAPKAPAKKAVAKASATPKAPAISAPATPTTAPVATATAATVPATAAATKAKAAKAAKPAAAKLATPAKNAAAKPAAAKTAAPKAGAPKAADPKAAPAKAAAAAKTKAATPTAKSKPAAPAVTAGAAASPVVKARKALAKKSVAKPKS